jgi:hypothetical protein
MVNGFSFFDIVEERILSCVHFRFRSLDLLHVAQQFPPLLALIVTGESSY